MDNLLRQIETEDVIIYEEHNFEDIPKERFLAVFNEMKKDGILEGEYDNDTWKTFSGITYTTLDFHFNEAALAAHLKKRIGIPVNRFRDIIRCYALYLMGVFVLPTIRDRISLAIEFSCQVGDKDYSIKDDQEPAIKEFLTFIGLSAFDANNLLKLVRQKKATLGRQRELKHLINYLVIADKINDLFAGQLSDEEYIRLFPIYFWVNITFIIPLRATEMIVTPFNCLEEKNGDTFIMLRRTQLKKKRRSVKYTVEDDYRIFTYKVPHIDAVRNIKKYQSLTGGDGRIFLFKYSRNAINRIFSLACFNELLAEFVEAYMVGNHRYDFIKYAAGVSEFEAVSAGDSRPIAMSNLFFQGVGADICRELAGHMNISTSAGYYTNVSNTVYMTSIVEMQRKINEERERTKVFETHYSSAEKEVPAGSEIGTFGCFSPRRPHRTGDIEDCKRQNHIHECLGCYYYHPNKRQLELDLAKRKERLDTASRIVFEQIADKHKDKVRERDFDRIFLEAHTSITRYKTACDSNAAEEAERWHRKRSTQMKS